ncbi:MAG: ATP-binding protein [Planctomycetota bacterium]|nr:ATP-binding protein [Planctomycetota bacterium]
MSGRVLADDALMARLLRFLEREDADERRSHAELRSLPVDERVLEGECIRGATFEGSEAGRYVFAATENVSKFRETDAVLVGDGLDFGTGLSMSYADFDAERGRLFLEKDPYARVDLSVLEQGRVYTIDRRPLDLQNRFFDIVRAGFADERLAAVLEGRHELERDEDRYVRAFENLRAAGLNEGQIRAGAGAIATESLALVQGPPGTGKTRLLAELLRALCAKGCRVAVCAYTHRAVDNVLFALRRLDAGVPLAKVGNPGQGVDELRRAEVALMSRPRPGSLPKSGVVAGTPFGLAKLPVQTGFHYVVFDEAGQMPIPHAIAGMQLSRRWMFFGDHNQLPPLVTAHHEDRGVARSIFEHLHDKYGSEMLDVTYRMNDGVCGLVGRTFYGDRLSPSACAGGRRLPFVAGGVLDDVLHPERPVVFARIDHLQPGMRSQEEAQLCADLIRELLRRHGVAPDEIAVIAPFRAQVRLIRSALQKAGLAHDALVVDTVERVQGQEREVVLLSLAVGDPAASESRGTFFLTRNRLNVALSRARTKAIVIGSIGAFRALPMDPEGLAAASVLKSLLDQVAQVDLTPVYGQVRAERESEPSRERASAEKGDQQVDDEHQAAEDRAADERA